MQVELHPASKHQVQVHGKRLSVVIAGRVVNISAVAKKLGMGQSNLSKFINGKRNVNVQYARRVASAIGISTDALLEAIDSRRSENLLKIA